MAVTIYEHPETKARTCVSHTGANLSFYADGTMDIDTGDIVFRLVPNMRPEDLAAWHRLMFRDAKASED